MKNPTYLRKCSWLLALCFVGLLALSACRSASKDPSQSGQPKAEHPKTEHPK